MSDEDVARAEALGRAAARAGQPMSVNPYPREQRGLRWAWAKAYAADGGLDRALYGRVAGRLAKVRRAVRKMRPAGPAGQAAGRTS